MADQELIGLQKYIEKYKEEKYSTAAINILRAAREYNANEILDYRWRAVKNLVAEKPEITIVMNIVKQAYQKYNVLLKEGKISQKEQQIVNKQVKDCNKMLIDAYEQLLKEGRITQDYSKQNRKLYSIKAQENLNEDELNLK